MADALIAYWLPESRVRIVGRTEYVWPVDWEGQRIDSVPVSAVELSFYAGADTSSGRGRATVHLSGGRSVDRDFMVTLHPDGRVASFSSKQVEQLDAIMGNAAKFVGAAAVIGLAFVNPASCCRRSRCCRRRNCGECCDRGPFPRTGGRNRRGRRAARWGSAPRARCCCAPVRRVGTAPPRQRRTGKAVAHGACQHRCRALGEPRRPGPWAGNDGRTSHGRQQRAAGATATDAGTDE